MDPAKKYTAQTERKKQKIPELLFSHLKKPYHKEQKALKINKTQRSQNHSNPTRLSNKLIDQLQQDKLKFQQRIQLKKAHLASKYHQQYQQILQSQKSIEQKQFLKQNLQKMIVVQEKKAKYSLEFKQKLTALKQQQIQQLKPFVHDQFLVIHQQAIKKFQNDKIILEELKKLNQQIIDSQIIQSFINEAKVQGQRLKDEQQKLQQQFDQLKSEEGQMLVIIEGLEREYKQQQMFKQQHKVKELQTENNEEIVSTNSVQIIQKYQSIVPVNNDKFEQKIPNKEMTIINDKQNLSTLNKEEKSKLKPRPKFEPKSLQKSISKPKPKPKPKKKNNKRKPCYWNGMY